MLSHLDLPHLNFSLLNHTASGYNRTKTTAENFSFDVVKFNYHGDKKQFVLRWVVDDFIIAT